MLYAVVETSEAEGLPGSVAAYRVSETGALSVAGKLASGGAHPCHLIVDEDRRVVVTANYSGATIGILRLDDSGVPQALLKAVKHEGSGPNPDRQEGPHPHQVVRSQDGARVYVCDLGTDEVLSYEIESLIRPPRDAGHREGTREYTTRVAAGSGPRHLAFSNDGYAYLTNELSNSVVVFSVDRASGRLSPIQEVGTLPAEYDQPSSTAEIAIHPSGRFVHVSNRGHDSIAVFARESDGRLSLTGHSAVEAGPRHFVYSPDGSWCLVAAKGGNTVTSYPLESGGLLGAPVSSLGVDRPGCVAFM
jgi:6-phosphogluconolactonase